MKFLLIILLICSLASCTPDDGSLDNNRTLSQIEGLYMDTLSVYYTNFTLVDTVIPKTIYKENDSTYWMPAFICEDSTYSCPPPFNTVPNRIFKFTVRPDGSIDIKIGAGDILAYNCSAYSFWNQVNYINVNRCWINGTSRNREIHRLRKL